MTKHGYTVLKNINCIVTYDTDNDYIEIIPGKRGDRLPFAGPDYTETIIFYENEYSKSLARIADIHNEIMYGGYTGRIVFLSNLLLNKEEIQVMEISGDEIDSLFDPIRYMFKRRQSGNNDTPDVLYDEIVLKKFSCNYHNNEIIIEIVLGHAFSMGFFSDKGIHSKIRVSFTEPEDIYTVYDISILIGNCIKELRFSNDSNLKKIELYESTKDGKQRYIGYIRNKAYIVNYGLQYREIDFKIFEKYLPNLFQQAFADNSLETNRENQLYCLDIYKKPSWRDVASIISSYESECKKHDLLKKDTSPIKGIREVLKDKIKHIPCNTPEEESFKHEILSEIGSHGNSYGQKSKMLLAYSIVEPSLDSSIDHILYLDENGHDKTERINNAVDTIVTMRNVLFHGDDLFDITKYNTQCIQFLQILTYALIMRRAGIDNETIEKMIDQLFK